MTTIEQAVEAFLSNRKWSKATRDTYGFALNRFLDYLAKRERIPRSSPTPLLEDLYIPDRYAVFLAPKRDEDRPESEPAEMLNERTYRLLLTVLAGFYRYLFKEGLIVVSATDFLKFSERLKEAQAVNVKSVSLIPKAKRLLPADEVVRRLIEVAKNETPPWPDDTKIDDATRNDFTLRQLRNVALLETLRSSGLRISEAMGLEWPDLDLASRTVHVRAEVAKGGKERTSFVSPKAAKSLRTYMRASGGPAGSAPVFQAHGRKARHTSAPLSPAGAQREIRRLRALLAAQIHAEIVRLLVPRLTHEALEAYTRDFDAVADGNLPPTLLPAYQRRRDVADEVDRLLNLLKPTTRITAHSLRHYAASRILEESENLAATQDILGHASTDTTRIYAELDVEHLRRAHRKAFGG